MALVLLRQYLAIHFEIFQLRELWIRLGWMRALKVPAMFMLSNVGYFVIPRPQYSVDLSHFLSFSLVVSIAELQNQNQK